MQQGYANGYLSTFVGRQMLVREVECKGMGHAACKIIGKPLADVLGKEVAERMEGGYLPDFYGPYLEERMAKGRQAL